jgi:hypothetical protein
MPAPMGLATGRGLHRRSHGLLHAVCLAGVVALCNQCEHLAQGKVVVGTTRTSSCFHLLATFQYGDVSDEEANLRISVDVPDKYSNVWLVALFDADIFDANLLSCDTLVRFFTGIALRAKGLPTDALDFMAYSAEPGFPAKTRAMRLSKGATQHELWTDLVGFDIAAIIDTCPLVDLVVNGFVC